MSTIWKKWGYLTWAEGTGKFRSAFQRAVRKKGKRGYKIPKFELEEIEDFYTYFVQLMGISEELFWNSEWSFLLNILENKIAVDNWMAYERKRQ